MLQVQKKKKRKARKWLVIAAVLALAVAAGVLVYALRAEQTPAPVREETGGSLVRRDTSEIHRITVQVRGRAPWTAERNAEGVLEISGEAGWQLDPILSERIEDALANVVYEDILTENPEEYRDHLEDFGLNDPALTARVAYTDGTELSFRIGSSIGLSDADFRFMTVDGDDRLYAVAGSLMEDLQVEQELLHPVEQPEIQTGRLDRITVLDEDGRPALEWRLQGAVTDADAPARWILSAPVCYPADQDAIGSLKKNVGNLRMGLFVSEATEERLAACGLDHPKRVIEIHLAAGTTGQVTEDGVYGAVDREEETLRFAIGNPRNEMTDYVLYGGTIYTMNHFTVTAVTETDPEDTLARYPVIVPLEVLQGVTIERADGTRDEYTLEYTARPADPEAAGQAAVRCLKNGAEIDYGAFAAAYQRWQVVTVSGRLPDGWAKRETETRYTFTSVSGQTHVLELSPYDALHDAVTLDGGTLFYLVRNGMGEMI